MPKLCKFSGEPAAIEFRIDNLFEIQSTTSSSRVMIGARRGELDLILDLCRELQGPFGILDVLLVSRRGNAPGRYQSPRKLDFDELEDALEPYRDFLEQDGRHNLWVRSFSGDDQFILDRHNVIFAYGDVERTTKRLKARGFQEAQVTIPVPHSHYYHQEFDASEDAMLRTWGWIKTDLKPSDT